MAYVGTPIDTTNQFQSLQGKRFSGDASTTAFTLDIAPSSVFDIEVFVENVRQDPNSAYSLSGTTLTFTGAPPSGTNNIYVVHQAKAVGTINPPDASVNSDKLTGNLVTPGTLDVNGQELILDADADTSITADTDDQIDLKAGGTDTMHVVNGDVRVGTPTSFGPMDNGLKVKGDITLGDFAADSGATTLCFIKSRNTTVGSQTIVSNGDEVGAISFRADDGDDSSYNNNAARIACQIDAAPGTNDMPGNILFETTADGARTTTERMRIDSSGKVAIGSTSPNRQFNVHSTGIPCARFQREQGDNNNRTHIEFIREGNSVGEIQCTNTSTTYATSSDHRLKENVIDLANATTRVKQLQPKRFNFIANADITVDGFLAHEVSSIVPEAITGTHNEVDEDGNPVYQGIDQSKLVPLLTASLQEAIAKIETLETEMTALKARVTTLENA